MPDQVRYRWIVGGRVQGVGYRAHVARLAERLKIVGSVRNLSDGTVEVVAQGLPTMVEAFRAALLAPAWPCHPEGIRRTEGLPPDLGLGEFRVAASSD
ncbi:MAG: acylphosphatase [Euryarchaeota archaeon]|nr:acylphosphatase [Euryarchaeota archaeon]MDE1835579.1 acylphosphatase [Euryarchaeota archaeon]MDE1878927.1 acylphosphatase [Euryarchaeota archaeon]MDE2043799.1 acylphosphatase [Thermoplasmata archaeon]